ncbi:MAG: universal stress protein [Pseudomonadota bacterium]
MTSAGSERRHKLRTAYYQQTRIELEGSTLYATITDLGIGGVSLEIDHAVKTGSDLLLMLDLEAPNPVELKGNVVWVQPVHMLLYRVGVKFTGLTSGVLRLLEYHIADVENAGLEEPRKRFSSIFSEFELGRIRLKNRLTMAPMFWGYAEEDGTVSEILLGCYREIAAGGVGMIVVANAVVDESGLMGSRVLRIDHDRFVPGLARLAEAIKQNGSVPCLQLNHAGRWAKVERPLAPSPAHMDFPGDLVFSNLRKEFSGRDQMRLANEFISRMMRCRMGMRLQEILFVEQQFAHAACRARDAGFEIIELHGATGYLLSQFLSPRSNRRSDDYGGELENRMRFPLEVLGRVREATGGNFPVGYRFLADEWLDGGFGLDEGKVFAGRLEKEGVAYLSVTAGTYESFFLPQVLNECRQEGYIAPYSEAIKKSAPATPVIASGRLIRPDLIEAIFEKKSADLAGLARPLFADPLWPKKVSEGRERDIIICSSCNSCLLRVMRDEPAVCARWGKVKRNRVEIEIGKKRSKWEKILIAVDDSENSLKAVEYAAHMTGGGKKITLFSVLSEYGAESEERKMHDLMVQAKRILTNAGTRDADIKIKTAATNHSVAEDILEEAKEGQFGSIIMGRRGVSRVHKLLFGSVSNYIVHHAKDCAVWVID